MLIYIANSPESPLLFLYPVPCRCKVPGRPGSRHCLLFFRGCLFLGLHSSLSASLLRQSWAPKRFGKCCAKPKRAHLWEYSRGVRGKAAWSCCARGWSGHEASHVGVSHAVITQTWKMLVFFLKADLLWWDSWLSVPTLYFLPLFFSSLVFLLVLNVRRESSDWVTLRLRAASQQPLANINWVFFSFQQHQWKEEH